MLTNQATSQDSATGKNLTAGPSYKLTALNHTRFGNLAAELLGVITEIGSQADFTALCRKFSAVTDSAIIPNELLSGSISQDGQFAELLAKIASNETGTIPTPWGGVVVTKYEHPEVQKFLVIKRGGALALEYHFDKTEMLLVKSGTCLLLQGNAVEADTLQARIFTVDDTVSFDTRQPHCLIALTDAVVWEESTDPRGMDQDLQFIFVPG